MSEMEYWEGILIEITIPEYLKSWIEQVKYLQSKGQHLAELDIEEKWFYARESSCILLSGKWYLFKKEKFDPNNMSEIKKIEENKYSFKASFYNGGGNLEEVLEHLIKKIKK